MGQMEHKDEWYKEGPHRFRKENNRYVAQKFDSYNPGTQSLIPGAFFLY